MGDVRQRWAFMLLGCMLTGFNTPTPVPASEGRIAFTRLTSRTEGNIYLMNADGAEQVQLTDARGVELSAAWSPDGAQIAYISAREGESFVLYVMNADGSDSQPLTDGTSSAFAPAWSPDGTRIAFICGFNTREEIHLINPDGSDEEVLAEGQWPSWSPDGEQLLITVGDDWTTSRLAIVNADGTNLTELEIDVPNASEGAWSPDGAQIAFVSSANDYEGEVEDWNEDLWVVNTDGTGLRHLVTLEGNDHWPPSWSPDGRQLAFTHDVSMMESHVYVVNVDDGELRELTTEGYSAFPAWHP
jgi:Tol biopolymer transport system component